MFSESLISERIFNECQDHLPQIVSEKGIIHAEPGVNKRRQDKGENMSDIELHNISKELKELNYTLKQITKLLKEQNEKSDKKDKENDTTI